MIETISVMYTIVSPRANGLAMVPYYPKSLGEDSLSPVDGEHNTKICLVISLASSYQDEQFF